MEPDSGGTATRAPLVVAVAVAAITRRITVCGAPRSCEGVSVAAAPDTGLAVSGGGELELSRIDTARGAVARIGGLAAPMAVSGDGRRVVAQLTDPPRTGTPSHVRGVAVVDVTSGATVWQRSGVVTADFFVLTRAGHAEMMVAISAWDGAGTGMFPPGPVDLLLIDARGAVRTLQTSVTDVVASRHG